MNASTKFSLLSFPKKDEASSDETVVKASRGKDDFGAELFVRVIVAATFTKMLVIVY